ncbi:MULTISPECIES: hypothetical protein [unclassified Nocardioides]|uniref:hypothetical protein n=1 Tax=unclassified Nocardioides TaxID=2615069 RepID=UPI0036217BE6
MTARDHRDELIVLIVLVLLASGILTALVLLQGDDAPTADPAPATSETAPAAVDGPEEAEEGAVLVGDQPFLHACRLVTRDDAQAVFGAFGPAGRVRQEYLSRTPGPDELLGTDVRSHGGVRTKCSYGFGDPGGHTLDVVVTQFRSAGQAERRWSELRDGNRSSGIVPRTDERLLVLPGQRSFAVRGTDFVVMLSYTTLGDLVRERPLTEREAAWQRSRMRQLLAQLTAHVGDGSAVTGPQPVDAGLGHSAGGTPYLDPCALLSDAVFEALGGAQPAPFVIDSSYLAQDPYADVPVSSCERRGAERTKDGKTVTTFAVLEVRVAPDAASAEEVRAKHLDNRYTSRNTISRLPTAAGTVDVVEVGGNPQWPWRTRAVHLLAGPYELHLSVLRDVTEARPYGDWVADARLADAVAALAGELDEATDPVP